MSSRATSSVASKRYTNTCVSPCVDATKGEHAVDGGAALNFKKVKNTKGPLSLLFSEGNLHSLPRVRTTRSTGYLLPHAHHLLTAWHWVRESEMKGVCCLEGAGAQAEVKVYGAPSFESGGGFLSRVSVDSAVCKRVEGKELAIPSEATTPELFHLSSYHRSVAHFTHLTQAVPPSFAGSPSRKAARCRPPGTEC
jgi:hypothetical protein